MYFSKTFFSAINYDGQNNENTQKITKITPCFSSKTIENILQKSYNKVI